MIMIALVKPVYITKQPRMLLGFKYFISQYYEALLLNSIIKDSHVWAKRNKKLGKAYRDILYDMLRHNEKICFEWMNTFEGTWNCKLILTWI